MNATWPLHGEAHGTHCSRSFCDVSRRLVGVGIAGCSGERRDEEEGQIESKEG